MGAVLLSAAAVAIVSPEHAEGSVSSCDPPARAASHARGRVVILPGIANVKFQFAGFAKRLQVQLPEFDVEIRRWGKRGRPLHNLRAIEDNRVAAEALADDLAGWRAAHPEELLYLVGYSGGGGIAVLSTADLPEGVRVDRLVLVAAAISPDFPLGARVLPHVAEFVATFASERDRAVGWGTRTFGTIDRAKTASAGSIGFALDDARLLEYQWSHADLAYRHHGHHLSYLRPRWQQARLMPVLDPSLTSVEVQQEWQRVCGGRSDVAAANDIAASE